MHGDEYTYYIVFLTLPGLDRQQSRADHEIIVALLAIGRAFHRHEMNETNLDLRNLDTQPDSCVFEVLRRSFPSAHDGACALYLTGFMLGGVSALYLGLSRTTQFWPYLTHA